MPFYVTHHAASAHGTRRLAPGCRMLPVQLFERGALLVIEHASEIVVVVHSAGPAVGTVRVEGVRSAGSLGAHWPRFGSTMRSGSVVAPA